MDHPEKAGGKDGHPDQLCNGIAEVGQWLKQEQCMGRIQEEKIFVLFRESLAEDGWIVGIGSLTTQGELTCTVKRNEILALYKRQFRVEVKKPTKVGLKPGRRKKYRDCYQHEGKKRTAKSGVQIVSSQKVKHPCTQFQNPRETRCNCLMPFGTQFQPHPCECLLVP